MPPSQGQKDFDIRQSPEYQQAIIQAMQGKVSNFANAQKYADFRFGIGDYSPRPKYTALQQTNISKLNLADTLLKNYVQQVKSLKLEEFGPKARFTGLVRTGLSKVGLDPKVKVYNDLKFGTIAPLIKALGDTGNLSNLDREYAIRAVPTIYDSKEEAQLKINFLAGILSKGRQAIMAGENFGATDITPTTQF